MTHPVSETSGEGKPNCSRHKRDVAGISDMKELATMIGDLHYETLTELFQQLNVKIFRDAKNDKDGGRHQLAITLFDAAFALRKVRNHIEEAWEVSKPYMTDNTQTSKS